MSKMKIKKQKIYPRDSPMITPIKEINARSGDRAGHAPVPVMRPAGVVVCDNDKGEEKMKKTAKQLEKELEQEIERISDEISINGKSAELEIELQEALRRASNLRRDSK